VKAHQPFGAFTSIPNVPFDGLIQITDISDGRRVTPSDFPPIGSEVETIVLGFKEFGKQIWLGMRPSQLLNVFYVDQGSGLPVVLLHGFPLDHTMWAAQIEALADVARVIAPDLRGFGRTRLGTINTAAGVSMEQHADDVAELLDRLAIREPVVLCGFSMGGYVAWQVVRKYPERLRALVPWDTRVIADTDEARAGRIKMAENVAEWGSARVADMMGPKLFAAETFQKLPDVVTAVREVVGRTTPAGIAAAALGMAARPDMTRLLPTIKVPTLVIVGEHDAISSPPEMKGIAEAIPGAEFVVIPDAGHMSTMENPQAANEAIVGFVQKLKSGR
jgi:pimeloyl-ACP methyl ester carboxylesterase